ncbi:MAG TPA: hypothetical protein VNR38_12695 [Ureibacillus sp.]|nr:hypothetical protein [Ureibacillus sp.]
MNLVKGSFYVFFQTYKKQNVIFWSVLLAIVLFSFFVVLTLVQDTFFMIILSVPIYIFFVTMGSKWLTSTFSYFMKFGLTRLQYVGVTGLFFLCWSLVTALFSTGLHQGIFFLNRVLELEQFMIFHPLYFINPTIAFHFMFLFDFVLLFLCLLCGLLLNYIFFKFGLVGGYSFIGLMVFIPILAIALKWYIPLFDVVGEITIVSFCGVIALVSIVLYTFIAFCLRKLSAVTG